MKILILSPHFYPESFKCNDMAFELAKRGHDVSVMTAIPDYPEGKFMEGYGLRKKRKETVNGVKVHRSFIVPRGKASSFRLAINYISYTIFATLKAFWYAKKEKYDAVIVHETSPVTVGIPAVIIRKLQKIPLHFWVLDLWPESLSAAGGIRNKFIIGIFNKITKWIYRNSDNILISSKGFREAITAKGDFDSKIKYFPNWVENSLAFPKQKNVAEIPSGFNVMFAGNMGDAQDLPAVLNAALKLKYTNINFIFIGDGRKKPYLKEFVKQHGLLNKVFFYDRYPLDFMPSFFSQADILFLSLKDKPIFSLTAPARLQAYMSAGKPIVAMLNGEGTKLIEDAACGWSVNAGDSDALADLLLKLSKENKNLLVKKGMNGKKFCKENFQFKDCIDNLEKIMINEGGNHTNEHQ